MNSREWHETVPAQIKGDSVWKSEAYRLALFLADLCWHDSTTLLKDKRTISADQFFRSAGGVSADIEEGYSRGSGRDRARFYEYALGSAREARGWYCKGRHVLREQVSDHRIWLLTHIIKLLLAMVPDQRGHALHEDGPIYRLASESDADAPEVSIELLLDEVPMVK